MEISVRKITVIGAGFSGLVAAEALVTRGWQVTVREASSEVGGMIRTLPHEMGRIETAANGILNSVRLEALALRNGIVLRRPEPASRKREIFRDGRASRWPLTVGETAGFFFRLSKARRSPPRDGESVTAWADRVLGEKVRRYLVAPALQGIYAGDPERLSAPLIFRRFYGARKKGHAKPHIRGTVSVAGGMGEFIAQLRASLESRGVVFSFGDAVKSWQAGDGRTLLAVPLEDAREILRSAFPDAARALDAVERVPIVAVNLAFSAVKGERHGFGCLFPRGEGVRSLGVLFEQSIFGDRSAHHLERWILGGALDRAVVELDDRAITEIVMQDRQTYSGGRDRRSPLGVHISRWPNGLPHYTLDLERALQAPAVLALDQAGVSLSGNFAGKLGLSGILDQVTDWAERLNAIRN